MTDLSTRHPGPEWMDDPNVTPEAMQDCLRDLERVNRWTFAYRPTLQWVRRQYRHGHTQLLDVGYGGGDMLRRLRRQAPDLQLTGIDLNPLMEQIARRATLPDETIDFRTGDIYSSHDLQPDLIISSLLTHHLTDAELVTFLQWMTATAKRGWFINDLHRHTMALRLFRILARLLRVDPMVRHDGAISVQRAFTRADWQRLIAQAGLNTANIRIRWEFPFRTCVAYRHA